MRMAGNTVTASCLRDKGVSGGCRTENVRDKYAMARMSIRTKMLGGIGAILVVLWGLSLVSWWAVSDLRSRVEHLDAQSVQGTVALAGAQDALWQLRYGFPQFMVLSKPEDKKKIVDDEPKLYKQFEDNLNKYRALDLSPEMAAQTQGVTQTIAGIAAITDENSSAASQISAASDGMSGQVTAMIDQARQVMSTADELQALVSRFQFDHAESGAAVTARRRSADWAPQDRAHRSEVARAS
jgi:methyl-accepting chemotaxis protein